MAGGPYRDIYGWETGAAYGIALGGGSEAQAYITDGTARTGCYYGKCLLRSTGGYLFTRTFQPSIVLVPSVADTFTISMRVALRLVVAPDADGTAVCYIGNGAGALPIDVVLRVNTDLTCRLYSDFAGAVPIAAGSILLNTWVLVTLTLAWDRHFNPASGGFWEDTATWSVSSDGSISGSSNRTYTNAVASNISVDRVGLGTATGFNLGTVTAGEAHFDDLVIGFGVSLPTSTRIRLLPVLAQGSFAAWTGSYTDVQEIPLSPGGAGQTSTGAGQVTTFTHATLAQFGISTVEVVKIYGHCKATIAGPTTQQIRLNGVDYPVSITNGYQGQNATPIAIDWAPSGFDAMEFGFVNSTGASLTLGAIHGEVLYTSGDNWYGCNAPTGVDPNGPWTPPVFGCQVTLPMGTDSGGGSGCQPTLAGGTDSGGGAGCQVTL